MTIRVRGGREIRANLERVRRRMKKLESKRVEVGFFEDGPRYKGDPRSSAQVAFSNEYGTKAQDGRPFMRHGVRAGASDAFKQVKLAPDGKVDTRSLQDAGERLKDSIRQRIGQYGVIDSGLLKRAVDVRIKDGNEDE